MRVYLCIILLCFVWSFDAATTKPEQIHLSLGDNVNEMMVTWNTRDPVDSVAVEYGKINLVNTQKGYSRKFGHTIQQEQYVHRAKMINLEPHAIYKYRVGCSSGNWSETYSFRTLQSGQEWSPNIILYGDMGVENAVSLPNLKTEVSSGQHDLIFHIGDIGYDMYEQEGAVGDAFMNMIEPVAARIPYMTCVGNHEWHYNFTNYKNRFTMPGGDGESFFYSFDVGPIHFVAISTEFYYYVFYGIEQIRKQYAWLENDLKEANKPENRAKRPWIITFGHRPMYCSNAEGEDCFEHESIIRNGLPIVRWYGLEQLWGKYGVDVAFWAHQHSYERMWPIYNREMKNGSLEMPYVNPRGPVHIVTGSAGCRENLDPFLVDKPAWSAVRISDYGYTKLKAFNRTHLSIKQFSTDKHGEVVDDIMVVQNNHGPFQ